MRSNSIGKKVAVWCSIIASLGLLTGCMGMKSSNPTAPTAMTAMATNGLAPVNTLLEGHNDIELPIEMTLDLEKSMATKSDSFQGGIYVYRGRVQLNSLKDYLVSSMRNNKWKLVSEFAAKNIILAFTKPNKTCMVVLSEDGMGSLGKTQANFYVTVDLAAANRLNPFGEPVSQ